MKPNGIITLLTDFGERDPYVAIMKGVILGIAPDARIIDYTHDVGPQAIGEAAYLLQSGYSYFPAGTIHVVVVDPGVGGERRPILLATPLAYFVGPDNGVLAPILDDARDAFGPDVQLVELSEQRYWLPEISRTFHGRDVFAPVAAHLLRGVGPTTIGQPVEAIAPCVTDEPRIDERGVLRGELLHVDRFGNCISSITRRHLNSAGIGDRVQVEIAGQRVSGLYPTYAAAPFGILIALLSSSGHLEIAVRNGNAARALGVMAGDRLRVLPSPAISALPGADT